MRVTMVIHYCPMVTVNPVTVMVMQIHYILYVIPLLEYVTVFTLMWEMNVNCVLMITMGMLSSKTVAVSINVTIMTVHNISTVEHCVCK